MGLQLNLFFVGVFLLLALSLSEAKNATAKVVGLLHCNDCIKNQPNASSGLDVLVICTATRSEKKREGNGAVDEEGKFSVTLSSVTEDPSSMDGCYVKLQSKSGAPCPIRANQTASVRIESDDAEKKRVMNRPTIVKFSPITCQSATFWPFPNLTYFASPPDSEYTPPPSPEILVLPPLASPLTPPENSVSPPVSSPEPSFDPPGFDFGPPSPPPEFSSGSPPPEPPPTYSESPSPTPLPVYTDPSPPLPPPPLNDPTLPNLPSYPPKRHHPSFSAPPPKEKSIPPPQAPPLNDPFPAPTPPNPPSYKRKRHHPSLSAPPPKEKSIPPPPPSAGISTPPSPRKPSPIPKAPPIPQLPLTPGAPRKYFNAPKSKSKPPHFT